jgi:hypothetical protein
MRKVCLTLVPPEVEREKRKCPQGKSRNISRRLVVIGQHNLKRLRRGVFLETDYCAAGRLCGLWQPKDGIPAKRATGKYLVGVLSVCQSVRQALCRSVCVGVSAGCHLLTHYSLHSDY